ncbi:hypothetical protein Tco_0920005 [Tanacetum coccineum]
MKPGMCTGLCLLTPLIRRIEIIPEATIIFIIWPYQLKEKISIDSCCHDSQISFLSFIPAHRLKTSDRDLLKVVVSMKEIKTTVWDCGSHKAPGPHGYSFLFINRFWDLLKHDIQEFAVSFFSTGKFPQGVSFAFITLIPKVSNRLFIKDYRPIYLIGLHYKIVAKILSNRLSNVIDSIISLEQSAFISGRQILDGPLILSEIIDWTSILINGSPTSEFSLKRGLSDIVSMAACTGYKAGSFPFSYLGLPIGSNMSRIANWQILIDRFKARLSGWKSNLLSIGGRLTLIKSVLRSLDKLKETNAFIRPLEGDARKTYGEYVCFNVLEGCQVIISELEIVKTDMISKRSLQLHDVGVITFKLNGSWIAQRVEKMLFNGIDTWAPVIYERRARAVFLSRTNTPYMNDDMLRADCIKQALVRMFLYSGIDVFDADSDNRFCDPSYEPRAPSNHVYAELETIKYGVCMDKADVMVYVTPHLKRDYIQECFTVRNFYTAA